MIKVKNNHRTLNKYSKAFYHDWGIMTIKELKEKSILYRETTLRIIRDAQSGHTGGDLSCIDILNVLYNEILNISPDRVNDPNRDRYVQSKGHAAEALYAVLSENGFMPKEWTRNVGGYLSPATGHPTKNIPGIEQNTGALGHGLPMAVGMAIAGKLDERPYRVFTLIGDGELAEGTNWEASMAASHYQLDNLIVIIDRNRLQISGTTEEVMGLEPLQAKFESFGFCVREVDGNDVAALSAILKEVPFEKGRPSLVIAHTIKGKGVSFMENQVQWHHAVPTDEQFRQAIQELENERMAL